jgi:hypothetical protein
MGPFTKNLWEQWPGILDIFFLHNQTSTGVSSAHRLTFYDGSNKNMVYALRDSLQVN